jgi:hypothetical protein
MRWRKTTIADPDVQRGKDLIPALEMAFISRRPPPGAAKVYAILFNHESPRRGLWPADADARGGNPLQPHVLLVDLVLERDLTGVKRDVAGADP